MGSTGDGWTRTPHRSKKDTKRWCRGKPGVEHEREMREDRYLTTLKGRACRWVLHYVHGRFPKPVWSCRHQWVCRKCNKVLTWRVEPEECPERVEEPKPLEAFACECEHRYDGHSEVDGSFGRQCDTAGCGCKWFRWTGAVA